MKKKFKIVYDFLKQNIKLLIPLTLIFVLFISFFVYYKVSLDDSFREYKDIDVYQYFNDKKYEYTALVGFNRKKEIVNLSTDDYDITYDSTPIYYKYKNKVIFPNDMSIVMPTLNCSEYLSPKFSLITKKDTVNYLKTVKYDGKIGHFFLYDGLNLFFFLDAVKLTINNQEIKLSPLSYVYTSNVDPTISYYDKKTDTYKTVKVNDYKSTFENDYYKVYISTDQIDYFGQNINLTSKLDFLKSIDLKGN